jgi:hypothetical protein
MMAAENLISIARRAMTDRTARAELCKITDSVLNNGANSRLRSFEVHEHSAFPWKCARWMVIYRGIDRLFAIADSVRTNLS